MANRFFPPLEGVSTPGTCIIHFKFFPNGTSTSALVVAPALASTSTANAYIASVIRTATAGQFTITLVDKYVSYLYGNAQIHLNTPATDLNVNLSGVDVVTNKTVLVNVVAAGAATDITGGANNYITVQLVLCNSGLVA